MLSREELTARIKTCRPEVKTKMLGSARANSEGSFFCEVCRSYFRQRVCEMYTGLPKKCNCKKANTAPWVPEQEEKMREMAITNYSQGLTVAAISGMLGVSKGKVYVYLRGSESCYDQRLR